jgi:hypothetical protein
MVQEAGRTPRPVRTPKTDPLLGIELRSSSLYSDITNEQLRPQSVVYNDFTGSNSLLLFLSLHKMDKHYVQLSGRLLFVTLICNTRNVLLYAMYQKSHIFAVLIERHGAIIRQYTTR